MKSKDMERLMEESNRDRVTDPNIVVYYLDESFGKHYMFIADNIVRQSADSITMSLREYEEGHNSGELNGWVTFRYKEIN